MLPRYLINALLVLLALIFLVGCSGVGSSPVFKESDEISNDGATIQPSISGRPESESLNERLVYRVGPIDIPAKSLAKDMIDKPATVRFQISREVWALAFIPKIVDGKGAALPSALLHEARVSNMHDENPLCPGSGKGNPFMIATQNLSEVTLPKGYGYPILATDPIEITASFSNPSDQGYVNVYFELQIVARRMDEYAKVRDVKPMLLEISPCTHESIDIAPGEIIQRSAEYQMPFAGELVFGIGAMQDFGSSVNITLGKDKSPIWSAEAVLDKEHHISEIDGNPLEDQSGIPIKSGESVKLGIVYDNSSELWLNSATAAVITYFAIAD